MLASFYLIVGLLLRVGAKDYHIPNGDRGISSDIPVPDGFYTRRPHLLDPKTLQQASPLVCSSMGMRHVYATCSGRGVRVACKQFDQKQGYELYLKACPQCVNTHPRGTGQQITICQGV